LNSLLNQGVRLFNEGRYFECHEVLEEEWTHARGPRRPFLQALIHVAVGLYHYGRDNRTGAVRQLRKALLKLAPCVPVYEGVDTERLQRETAEVAERIEAGEAGVAGPRIHMVVLH
jgi:uncharacterized protein